MGVASTGATCPTPTAYGYYVPPPTYTYAPACRKYAAPPTYSYPPAYDPYAPPSAHGDYGDYPLANGDYPSENGY
jgi:hypothetical protein